MPPSPRALGPFSRLHIFLLLLFYVLGPARATLGASSPLSAAAPAAANAPAAPPPPRFPVIVVFRDLKSVLSLRAMCHPNPLIFRLRAAPLDLPAECHLPGICRRVYSTAIFGFAGEVTEPELAAVGRCLPRAVWYRELDGRVEKAEEGGAARSAGRRRLQQTPAPRVHAFEVFDAGRAQEGPPLALGNITGGAAVGAFSAPGDKRQSLGPTLWNLDRLDQRALPLDGAYVYGSPDAAGTGAGVTIYTIDSGIIPTHQEFQTAGNPGVSRASYGYDFVEDDEEAADCDGHGTHVAATAAGLQVGVAKAASIVSVRILDCMGSGTISDTVAALDWVAANARKPAVATLSLGIQTGSWSRVLEDAVRSLTVNHGVTVVVASGNSAVDACYVAPANVPEVLTVAATDVPSKYNGTAAGDAETMYRWSNTGPCVDLFAPGVDIYSACGGQGRCPEVTDDAYTFASGTSMAVPAVAGVAALYLEANPGAGPRDVAAALGRGATSGAVSPAEFRQGTPNKLLYSRVASKDAVVAAAQGPGGP